MDNRNIILIFVSVNNQIKYKTMAKRVVKNGLDVYEFTNSTNGDVGMLIVKNGEELGVYPHFEYGDNLDDNYLIELALEFEEE